jgi:glutamate racemase
MTRPIGIFDSGVGGLTVLGALRERLPGEDFVYLGDTARLPYGTKSASTVQRYALNAAAHLAEHDVKLLVVACNTASSYALEALAAVSPVPVVGVVEPGVRAALATGARRIGVIGTEGTVRSGAYQAALARLAPAVEVEAVACPLLVPLAEEGWGDHPVTDEVARIYLAPLLAWGVETVILGCTHYPLLRPSLERVAGPGVRLVDSASAVAETLVGDHAALLGAVGRPAGGVRLELTDASDRFLRITRAILGGDPERLELVDI